MTFGNTLLMPTNRQGPANWPQVLDEIRRLSSDLEQLNAFINRVIRYRRDVLDEWEGPIKTAKAMSGDCEDIAGLKLALLPHPNRWLMVGHYNGRPHAVAVVEAKGTLWVLDNLTDAPYKLNRKSGFVPAYALGVDGASYLVLETRKHQA